MPNYSHIYLLTLINWKETKMFYHTIKEYKSVRYKGYDIFLELKANNMMIASCLHDDDRNSFTNRYMDYSKKEVVSMLKDKINQMKGN